MYNGTLFGPKKKEMTFATSSMNLEDIMLNKIRQREKDY